MGSLSDLLNIIFGILSLLALISGYFVKEYQIALWTFGLALLILVIVSYYVFDSRNKVNELSIKFKKIEESLNIYDRLNKLEIKIENMVNKKRGELKIELIDIIKIGIAIILIIVFIQAIKSLL
jgi:hypothetical protein